MQFCPVGSEVRLTIVTTLDLLNKFLAYLHISTELKDLETSNLASAIASREGPVNAHFLNNHIMTSETLSERLEDYLAGLADFHNFDIQTVDEFCHAIMVVNGETMHQERYHELFKKRLSNVTDLLMVARILIVDEANGKIGARISMYSSMTTQPVLAYEHNFYEWRNGKIAEVWTVVEQRRSTPSQARARVETQDRAAPATS